MASIEEDGLNRRLVRGSLDESFGPVQRRMQEELSQSPNTDRAKQFRLMNSISDWSTGSPRQFAICSTSSRDLGSYSIGLELYLLYIKQLFFIFFFVSLISIWPIYNNYNGDFIANAEVLDQFTQLTLANQKGMQLRKYSDIFVALEEANELLPTIEDNYRTQWLANFLYTSLFLILILVFYCQGNYRIKDNLRNIDLVTDYSIEVEGLPEYNVTSREVRDHFSSFGDVVEVYLGRIYEEVLFDYRKQAKIKKKAYKRFHIVNGRGKNPNTDYTYMNYQDKINALDAKIGKVHTHRSHNDLPVKAGYVIFNTKSDRNKCLRIYNKCCVSDRYRFRGVHSLKVRRAPEPSNILWENLEIGKCSQLFRGLLIKCILLVFLVGSVAMIYYVKTADEDIPSIEECGELDIDFKDLSYQDAKDSLEDETEKYCWCKEQDIEDLVNDSDIRSFCYGFVRAESVANTIRFFSSFGVIIVNLFLKTIIKKFIVFERLSNLSSVQVRIMIRVFVAMFINTAFITLLVNGDLSAVPFVRDYLLTGEYADFTRDWYISVGSVFFLMALVSMVWPHLFMLIIAYPVHLMRRSCCSKKSNQYDLNQAVLGRHFDMAGRMASINTIVFVCFLYSGGMPILNFICLAALFLIYWSDKTLLLRYHRKPPYLSESMYIASMSSLYLCVFLHCLISGYMYGCPEIFPEKFTSDDDELIVEPRPIYDRMITDSGYAFIVLAVAAVGLYFFSYLFVKIYKSCMRRLNSQSQGSRKTSFHECAEQNRFTGLTSYKITHNPTYAPIINAMNEAHRKTRTEAMSRRQQREEDIDYASNLSLSAR